MNNLFITDKIFTRADIAQLLNISVRQVSNLIAQGVLPSAKGRDGMNPQMCIHAYIAFKSQGKEPILKEETLPQNEELAFEKKERQLKLEDRQETIAMKRAKRVLFEKTYAPIEVIVDALQQVGSRMSSHIDGLVPKIKLAWPEMPPEAIEVLEAEIAATMNECADVQPDLSKYFDEESFAGFEDDAEDMAFS
ncbi:DNA topoisomerase VI subunit B [Vibrio parahaemolyticus]|uniref:hypothetical protein n=1 Tax=Vibrio parahaemolyticus TaxID=670 RepID=UPI0008FC9903|nr:hypothetical protein [Vibrio parahaemolyticus]APC86881.1 Phage protein [Vibrio parahaemolyticus]EHK7403229.1 hypothetical protein [Vibrio parahaemolyticus]EHR5477392.1 hypothetical protein [Vibrio parahaemolyticus]OOQ69858.1 hypothetical protein BSR61_11715 [Vibrio parahaemolyticus]PMT78425.1 DNA topoisomerase VI subunit B [Vibrio parahaemolyticus]